MRLRIRGIRGRILIIGWVALCLVCSLVHAQVTLPGSSVTGDELSGASALFGRSSGIELPSAGAYLEGAVDSTEYMVGPGDIFRVFFWKPTYNETLARVSADGDLAIPLVGLVRVAGLTLAEAKLRVAQAVGRSFRYGEVGLSLLEPRKFRVHVTGMVEMPGSYAVPATARVSDAILLARGLRTERTISGKDTSWSYLASRRNIELRDASGAVMSHADMQLFEQGGVLAANPLLRDGWTVYVPAKPSAQTLLSVYGAVGAEGDLEYAAGDKVRDVLRAAGGLTTNADLKAVRVVSLDGQSKSLDLTAANSADWEFGLKIGDRVLVGEMPDAATHGSVSITGEVARPGGYAIVDGKTTVRELIAEAGGFTELAVARSARLERNPDYDPARREKSRIVSGGTRELVDGPTYNDAGLFAELTRWDYGTVVLNLGDGGDGSETVLYAGDHLTIPRAPLGVRVLGSVNNAGEVDWHDDWNLTDYVSAAGGKTKGSWLQRTVVIRAKNGSQVRYSKQLAIDPGDLIYVPQKPFDQSAWTTFKDFISVAAQVATVVLVVQQATK